MANVNSTNKIAKTYDLLITLLAALGGALVVSLVVTIVGSVTIRAVGGQPPQWTTTFAEYAMLYMTLLAAPWLVRERANVVVDTLINVLPKSVQYGLDRLVCALCLALAIIIALFGAKLTITSWNNGDYDIRAVSVPYWIFRIIIPIGFTLIAIEFARHLLHRRIPESSGTARAGL